jgi:hypothetical protein
MKTVSCQWFSQCTKHARILLGMFWAVLTCMLLVPSQGFAQADVQNLPDEIRTQLPSKHRVMTFARAQPRAGYEAVFVVMASEREAQDGRIFAVPAPARPALLYVRREGGRYHLAARNDNLILRANEGGQCDPFEFGAITARGSFVTFEHSVACGNHWTDFVTFRFDAQTKRYFFDNHRFGSQRFNPDQRGDAPILVDDPVRVVRARGARIEFAAWRRQR